MDRRAFRAFLTSLCIVLSGCQCCCARPLIRPPHGQAAGAGKLPQSSRWESGASKAWETGSLRSASLGLSLVLSFYCGAGRLGALRNIGTFGADLVATG